MNVASDERRSADEMILTATIGSSMGDICESDLRRRERYST